MEGSEIRARYLTDGHVVVSEVIDGDAVAELSSWVTAFEPHTPANGVMALNPALEPARSFGSNPRFVALAEGVLDAEPVCFGVSFVVKPPGVGLPVLWHQDGHPWRERWGIDHALTLWVAVDPVTPDRGGLTVIPGSHSLGLFPLVPAGDLADDPGPNVFDWTSPPEVVEEALGIGTAQVVVLEPGDVSVHHSALVHASGPNRSPHRRAALALRYHPAR